MNVQRLARATFFIAACTIGVVAAAQNSPINILGSGSAASTGQSIPAKAGSVVTTDQVRAELLAWAPDGVEPGRQVWVALRLDHQPEWHTYW